MKKLSLLLTLIFASLSSFAQDIIVTNDAKKIDAKILEVSTSEIRYKELDNLDGPIFILRTDEINSIIYANGKVVLFKQATEEEMAKQRAQEAEAAAKANALGSLFEQSGNSVGSGVEKVNPVGHNSTGGNSWSLPGRSIAGTLPKPGNTFNQEGQVIVEICVNAAGNVISATHKGGNVSDKQTIQLALEAARKARFSIGDGEQIGTITYNFKFN